MQVWTVVQGMRVDGVREALEAVHCPVVVCLQTMKGDNGNQDVFDTAIAQIVHHREPEFGPFVGGNPQAQNLTFALRSDAQGHLDSLVLDLTAFRIADFNA